MGAQCELRRTRAPSTIRPRFSMFGRQNVRVFAPTRSQFRSQSLAPKLDVSHTGADLSAAHHRAASRGMSPAIHAALAHRQHARVVQGAVEESFGRMPGRGTHLATKARIEYQTSQD